MKMKNITFEQFINTYNFREVIPSRYADSPCRDTTKIIRINFEELAYGDYDCWFEFGVYDWAHNKHRLVNEVLSDKILNSYVESISYSDEDNVLIVDLTNSEYRYIDEDNGDNITFSE